MIDLDDASPQGKDRATVTMRTIDFAGRPIGPGHPVFIIAEIGVNHNGSPALAHKLVDIAADAGCDAVKLQRRSIPDLYVSSVLDDLSSSEQSLQYMIPLLSEVELSDEDFVRVKEHAEERGLIFFCTPFDIPSVGYLESLGIGAFKIGSPDLTNIPLIDAVVATGKPFLLSTGMASEEDVTTVVRHLEDAGATFGLFHCNSTYPTPFEEVNLRYMQRLMDSDAPVGYSGHERGIAISTAAVALGATMIERHVTLDRTMVGPDHAASLEPVGLQRQVRDIRNLELALGSGRKHVSRMEVLNREVLGKSLYAARDVASGTAIAADDVCVKGPAKGLSPLMMSRLVGRTTSRDIRRDEPFSNVDIGLSGASRDVPSGLGMWGFVVRSAELADMRDRGCCMIEVRLTDQDVAKEVPPIPEYDIPLVVHLPEYDGRHLVDIASLIESERRRSVEACKRALSRAAEVASHFPAPVRAVIHPTAASMEPPSSPAPYLDSLARSLDELRGGGIELLPENLPPRPWYFGGEYYTCCFMDPDEIARFAADTGHRITLDISHLALYCNSAGIPLASAVATLVPFASHMHVADAYGIHGEGAQIGQGDIDFAELAPLVAEYTGTWIPEIWQGHQHDFDGYYAALQVLGGVWVLSTP